MADLPDYYTQAQISEAEAASVKGGLDANKSPTPVSRQIYFATDTGILYICVVDGTWTGFDASMLTQGILTLYANMLGGGFQIKNIADPTAAQDAATRAYVLAQAALRLALTGGTMSGNIAMGTKKLTGLGAPTAQNDSLRYGQAEIRNAEIAVGAAIALAKLASAVYTQAEVNGLISDHADIVDAHHPEFDIFGKFYEFIPWVSLDGFSVGGNVGYTAEARSAVLRLTTPATTDDDIYVRNDIAWYKLLDAGKVITVEFPIHYLSSVVSQNIWLHLAELPTDPPTETNDHFGWKIINADLYASNADGTTQTITDTGVDLTTGTQRTRLKMVFTPGTDCKFYVNDVLKATHTTNLPDALDYKFNAHVRAEEDVAKTLYIGRLLLVKEHA